MQELLEYRRRYIALRPVFRAIFNKFDRHLIGFIDASTFEGAPRRPCRGGVVYSRGVLRGQGWPPRFLGTRPPFARWSGRSRCCLQPCHPWLATGAPRDRCGGRSQSKPEDHKISWEEFINFAELDDHVPSNAADWEQCAPALPAGTRPMRPSRFRSPRRAAQRVGDVLGGGAIAIPN